VNFDVPLGEAFERFYDGAFCAVTPVNKRGSNREPQVRESSGA
jgi:hypothetical protein